MSNRAREGKRKLSANGCAIERADFLSWHEERCFRIRHAWRDRGEVCNEDVCGEILWLVVVVKAAMVNEVWRGLLVARVFFF